MKKIFYTFLAALLTTACVEPLQPYLGPITNEPTDAATMTLQFSIPVSPATKGEMTDQPNITSSSTVHVFVYNAASGALLQVSPATLKGTVTANTPWGTAESAITNHADFVVEVAMGSAHRYLQVVVDAPTYSTEGSTNDNETGIGYADNPIYLGDSESDVASKLYTKGKKTAYWQRIDLPNGLQAYTYPGGRPEKGIENTDWTSYNDCGTADKTDDWYIDKDGDTVNYDDYVNGTGQKITDGTGYVMSTDVANRVKYIPLVRNFVKISVSKAADGTFTPEKAVLINVPAAGYIAPYSSASGFVPYYLKDKYLTEQDKTLSDLPTDGTAGIASTGYMAPVPNDEFITACPDEDDCVEATNGIIPLYMYERGVATSTPTQLLVFGRFDGSNSDCWLKIDITDTDGHYIAFYRDLTYEMEIGAITGTSGYGTMQKAYEMPSIGNPSSSEETQTLTQVSDGKGTMIWVDFIDYASFKKEANEVRLRYKFVSFDGSKTSADAVLTVTHSTGTGAVTNTNLSGSAYNGTDPTQDGQGGWYYVNVPLAAQGATIVRSVVRVSGTATNRDGKTMTLYRDVTFSVMPTQTMTVQMSTLPADAVDQPTTATITLQDGLGYSLFPLVIRIEAYNGSITPTDSNLPVGHGTSTFSTLDEDYAGNSAYYDDYYRTSGYYWYEKTISYDDYKSGTREYTANFKTIYDSGNETVVAFSDPDGHFHTEVAPLRGAPTFKLASDNTSVNVKASETSASFAILSNVGTWTVTADNGAEVVRTRANNVSGSGNATITVSFPDNMNGSTTKEYHVTATLDAESQALVENYHDLVFTIYQAYINWVPIDSPKSISANTQTFNTAGSYLGSTSNLDIQSIGFTRSGTGDVLNAVGNNYITLQRGANNNSTVTTTLTISAKQITSITITWDRANSTDYSVQQNRTSISQGGGSASYTAGSGTNNIRYPTTTWTNDTGSDIVSLAFTVAGGNSVNRPRIRSISITYSQGVDIWEP